MKLKKIIVILFSIALLFLIGKFFLTFIKEKMIFIAFEALQGAQNSELHKYTVPNDENHTKSIVINEKSHTDDIEFTKKANEDFLKDIPPQNRAEVYNHLSQLYYKREDFDVSRYYIEKALENDDKCHDCYSTLGLIDMKLEKFRDSLKSFNYSLSLNESASAYYNRHLLYLNHLNLKDKAIIDLKDSIKIDPKYYKSLYTLFFIYILDKNFSEAKKIIKHFKKIVTSDNSDEYNKNSMRITLLDGTMKYEQRKDNYISIFLLYNIEYLLNNNSDVFSEDEYLFLLPEILNCIKAKNKNSDEYIKKLSSLIDEKYENIKKNKIVEIKENK